MATKDKIVNLEDLKVLSDHVEGEVTDLKSDLSTGNITTISELEIGGLNATGKYPDNSEARTKSLIYLEAGQYDIVSDVSVFLCAYTDDSYSSGSALLWGVSGTNSFTVSENRRYIGYMSNLKDGNIPTNIKIVRKSYVKKIAEEAIAKANNSWSLSDATTITSGADLNTYTTFGNYLANNTIAASLTNAPTSFGGVLHVERAANATTNYLKQTYITASLTSTYYRYRNNGSWSPWRTVENTLIDRVCSFSNGNSGKYNGEWYQINKIRPNSWICIEVEPIEVREADVLVAFLDAQGNVVIGNAAFSMQTRRIMFRYITEEQAASITQVRISNSVLLTGNVKYSVHIYASAELNSIKTYIDDTENNLRTSFPKNYNFQIFHNYGTRFPQYRPNSIETISLAVDNQYDGYRCNVIRTADDKIVCSHDLYINYLARNLDGTAINGVTEGNVYTDGCIAFEDLTLSELKNNYSWSAAWPLSQSSISTLDEFLEEFVKHPLKLRIEFKSLHSYTRSFVDSVVNTILNHAIDPRNVYVESYSSTMSGYISDACDYMNIMPWYSYTDVTQYINESKGNGNHIVVPIGFDVAFTAEEVKTAKKLGALPYTTFHNDVDLMASRLAIGYTMGEGNAENVKTAILEALSGT